MTAPILLLALITLVPLVGVAVFVWMRRPKPDSPLAQTRVRIRFLLVDERTRARLRDLEERMARSQLGPCERFGHALIDGRCRRHGCTYTTQRSER